MRETLLPSKVYDVIEEFEENARKIDRIYTETRDYYTRVNLNGNDTNTKDYFT